MFGIGWIEIIVILVILTVLAFGAIAVVVLLVTSTKRRGGVESQTGRCPTCGQTPGPTAEGASKSGQQITPETR